MPSYHIEISSVYETKISDGHPGTVLEIITDSTPENKQILREKKEACALSESVRSLAMYDNILAELAELVAGSPGDCRGISGFVCPVS